MTSAEAVSFACLRMGCGVEGCWWVGEFELNLYMTMIENNVCVKRGFKRSKLLYTSSCVLSPPIVLNLLTIPFAGFSFSSRSYECMNESRLVSKAVSKPDYNAFLVDMVCTLPL